MLRERPDVVVSVQREAAAMAQRPGWAQLPALRQGRLCELPTPQYEMMIRPGPRLGEAAGILVDCLQRLSPPGAAR